ncbi:hypothetical protein LPJ72_001002 [Coemansia sp. Benny D160-2]|nr:hypothetical protein LPJ72_001002 [Coemansia sp. Benny D160-2]
MSSASGKYRHSRSPERQRDSQSRYRNDDRYSGNRREQDRYSKDFFIDRERGRDRERRDYRYGEKDRERDEYGRSRRRRSGERTASPQQRQPSSRDPEDRSQSPDRYRHRDRDSQRQFQRREFSERRRPSRFGPPKREHGGPSDPEYLEKRRIQREAIRFSIWPSSQSESEDKDDIAEEARVLAEQKNRLDEFANRGNDIPSDHDELSDALSLSDSDNQSESAYFDDSDSDSRTRRRKRSKKHSSSSRKSRKRKDSDERSRRKRSKRDKKSKHTSSKSHRRHKHRASAASDRSASSSDHSDAYSDKNEDDKKRYVLNKKPSHRTHEDPTNSDEHSDGEVGPMPASDYAPRLAENSFGGALLPGEGSAMAAYVQAGERIPRRGEIGVDQQMIERLETSGYVMSGNRHRRMDAVRQRKESQVASAEEKRQMLLQSHEDRLKKESQIIAEFKDMLSKKERQKR